MSKDSEVPSQRACQRSGPRHVPAPVSPPNLLLAVAQLLPFAPLTSIRLEMPPRSSRRRRGSCDFLRMSLGSRGFPREQHSELCTGFGNGASTCKKKPQNVTSPQNEDIRGEASLISGQLWCSKVLWAPWVLPCSPPMIILRLLPPLSSLPTGDVRFRGSPWP